MSLSINTNAGAIVAANAARSAQREMDEAMQRLSTGTKINSASDDPGALQVAIRMEAEINGLASALRNASDAQSTIDTGEAALNEVHTLLLRMRELSVAASTETATTSDRAALNSEVSALETEIDRIGASTTWGGINIFDGTYSEANPMVFQVGPRSGDTMSFSMGIIHVSAAAVAQGALGLSSDVTTRTNASAYISTIDTAISIVSSRRGSFGAASNRLDSTITNLTNMKANIQAAKGQVVDTDFAAETARLARAQILLQAATAMLSQANASKSQTLQLING
jgi:flagellin